MSLKKLFPESPVVQQIVRSCLEIVRAAIGVELHPGAVQRHGTERQDMDASIPASLHAKAVMLQKLHDWVNNNLLVVASLLKLQAGYIKDQEVLNRFRKSQDHKRDDGIGLLDEFNICKTSSLGLQLVCSLVAQLQGSLNLDRTQGTTFTITFNELTSKEGL